MDFLINLLLLPYTLLVWGLKYIIAIGLWYLLINWLVQTFETFDWEDYLPRRRRKTKDKYGDDPEDYIV